MQFIRGVCLAGAAFLIAALGPELAVAQPYPSNRAVKIIVNVSPGSSTLI